MKTSIENSNPKTTNAMKKEFKVKIDNDQYTFDDQNVTVAEILQKSNHSPIECFTVYKKIRGQEVKLVPGDTIDLAEHGLEKFTVKGPEIYTFTVNEDKTGSTDKPELTAAEIMAIVNISTTDYYLNLVNPDGTSTSYRDQLDTKIQMKCPGLEFVSIFIGEVPLS
jgi:hypothetical protein